MTACSAIDERSPGRKVQRVAVLACQGQERRPPHLVRCAERFWVPAPSASRWRCELLNPRGLKSRLLLATAPFSASGCISFQFRKHFIVMISTTYQLLKSKIKVQL